MTVHEIRYAFLQKARSERLAWAKEVDPDAVKAFEAKAKTEVR